MKESEWNSNIVEVGAMSMDVVIGYEQGLFNCSFHIFTNLCLTFLLMTYYLKQSQTSSSTHEKSLRTNSALDYLSLCFDVL
jgi:hypothetical protein